MFRRFRNNVELMRPRSFARVSKSLDDVVQGIRAIRRALKEQVESSRESERRHDQADSALAKSLADIDGRLQELTGTVAELALRESQLRAVATADASLEDAMRELPAVCNESRVVAHVREAVGRARLELDPLPHLVVSDVFPEDFYDALVRGIPPYELFAHRPHNKQQLKVPFEFGPAYSRAVWSFLIDVGLERAFQPAIVEAFHGPLSEWIIREWPPIAGDPLGPPMELHSTDGRILLRGPGYRIPPHRDPKWGFLTVLLYLPLGRESEQWGTQLYAVDEDAGATNIAPHWIDDRRCRLVVDVPFRRNTALAFLNSHGAHGACIPDDAQPPDLRRYIYQFRIGPTKAAIKSLVAMLPEERRSMWEGKLVDYLA